METLMVPAKGWTKPELFSDGFPVFSKKAVDALQSLISENTTIMLTTSHKSNHTIDEWKDIFRKRGIPIEKIKSLDQNIYNLDRKNELLVWFNVNTLNEDFLIIDDDKSLNALPEFLKKNLILTSPFVGLTKEHLENVRTIEAFEVA